MSDRQPSTPARVLSTTARPPVQAGFGRGPFGGMGVTGKPMRFGPSARRLLGRMAPERARLIAVTALGVTSVVFAVTAPRVLGNATDVIFSGAIGRQLPPGRTAEQVIAATRAAGHANLADLMARMHIVPGQGIDLRALGALLTWALALYAASSLFQWLQGFVLTDIVQGTVFRLRSDVQEKVHRLPLQYFDRQPRGELLSRVTNDIDNLAQSLQQTMSQMLTSVLTIIGVLAMMLWISPLLALIALVTVPVSVVVTTQVAKRSQKQFVAQWRHTGALNGHIEEAFTGHELVKVFGRQREVEQVFRERNEELFKASFGAQFISGLIMPVMMFIGNLNYVAIAVIGGLRVANGSMTLGDVQAFIQYSRQFTQPLTQVASMANLLQSGVASAERVFELLDAGEEAPDPAKPMVPTEHHGRVEFEHVSFRYIPEQPLIVDLSLVAEPGHTVAIVDRPGPARPRWSTSSCASTSWTPGGSPSMASTSPRCAGPTSARRSAWCCRTPGSSAGLSAATSPTATRTPQRRRSSPPPRRPSSTALCAACPPATTPSSTTRAATSAPARSSC